MSISICYFICLPQNSKPLCGNLHVSLTDSLATIRSRVYETEGHKFRRFGIDESDLIMLRPENLPMHPEEDLCERARESVKQPCWDSDTIETEFRNGAPPGYIHMIISASSEYLAQRGLLAESIEQRETSGGAKDAHDILTKLSSLLKDNGIDIAAARDALNSEGYIPIPTKRPRISDVTDMGLRIDPGKIDDPTSKSIVTIIAVLTSNPVKLTLSKAHPMVKLWKKFWGIPISDLHSGKSTISTDPSAVEVRPGDLLSDSKEKLFMENPFIISGSQLLTRNSNGKFLVRAEYLRMYRFVSDCIEKNVKQDRSNPPAVVITGQPGIGKTTWIAYTLRRRLGARLPTMIVRNSYYLFTDSGVEKVPKDSPFFFENNYEEPIWCLVDAADAPAGLPSELAGIWKWGVVPIYVTSPSCERWKKLHQSKTRYIGLMNPWTREEIDVAAREFGVKSALDRYEKFGPNARMCLDYSDGDTNSYNAECQSAILKIDDMARQLESVIWRGQELMLEDPPMASRSTLSAELSQKICLLKRRDVNIVSDRHDILIMSRDIADRIAIRLMQSQDDEILRVWKLYSRYDAARGMMDSIFEAYVHTNFRQRIAFHSQEMFRRNQGNYHAAFESYENRRNLKKTFGRCRSGLLDFHVNFRPLHCVVPPDQGLEVRPDTYYQPKNKQQVGIDSFIVHDDYLYLLQMTRGTTHDIKESLEPFLKGLKSLPPVENWRFVFVIPEELERFTCPSPSIVVGKVFTGKFEMLSENERKALHVQPEDEDEDFDFGSEDLE